MLTRHTTRLLAILAALVLPLGVATAANAQPAPTCAEATAAVEELESELAAAQAALVTSEGVLAVETAELEALPRPDEDALASAQASFDAADAGFEAELPELLEFSPDDYPGDVVPTLESLRVRANLVALLPESGSGSTLGAGAQVEVTEAILALDTRTDAAANLEFTQAQVEAAQAAINAQELVVLDAQGDVQADRDQVANLDTLLAEAREVRAQVCPTPTPTPTGTPTPTPTDDVDCEDVTDAEAQAILAADASDPFNLDADNDGIACEEDNASPSPSSTVVPAQPASRSGTLPRTGADAGFLVPLALLLLVGGATVVGGTKLFKGRATGSTL